MELVFARELDRDVQEAAFWWVCNSTSETCLVGDKGEYIPAPEYDWLYWCQDIPESDLDAEMKAECEEMYYCYLNRLAARKKMETEGELR